MNQREKEIDDERLWEDDREIEYKSPDIFKITFGVVLILSFNLALIFIIRTVLYYLNIGYGKTFHLNLAITFIILLVINYIFYKNRK